MQDRTLNLLNYDGMMFGLHQFTEVDPEAESFGATFYMKTRDPEKISRRREEKRIEFASAKRVAQLRPGS